MREYPWRIGIAMLAYYAITSVYQNFIPVYFGAQGLSDTEISMLMATIPLTSIFAQPIWGTVGDRMKSKNRLLRILYICSAVVILSLRISPNFLFLLPAIAVYSFFFTPLQPLNDAITLESLGRTPFGPARMMGTITFATLSAVWGGLLNRDINLVLYISAALMLIAIACSYLVPTVPGHQSAGNKMSFAALFKQKELLMLLGFMTPLQITMGYFYTFFSLHFTSLPGGSSELLGWCYFISAICEVPFLLLSDRLYYKFGAGKLLMSAAASITLRWILLGTLTNPYAVMATQALHGWGFIVMTVSMAHYVNDNVPDELKASGQMLLGVVGFGVARIVGNLGGALAIQWVGRQHAFYISAVISATAALCYIKPYLLDSRRKQSQYGR